MNECWLINFLEVFKPLAELFPFIILFHLFLKVIYLFLFSYNCLHFPTFPISCLLTIDWQHEPASVGILTPQKTANATNQRFSSSVEAVVKYHHTTTSIPNIFKSTSLLHFVRIVFNGVGVRTRARLFKKGELCVFGKRSHANLMLYTYISSVSLKHPPNPILCFLYWQMIWK